MKRIEIVLRTVGERTTELALELAKTHIRADRVFVIENVKPFSRAVEEMLRIDHDCDFVVHMDADSLILEDMQPFLELNDHPFTDCGVWDRFRGRIYCGVHITRIDVVRAMREISVPLGDMRYVLRPESRLRKFTLQRLGLSKRLRNFRILHDHFQYYRDIFAKYALRELRSRSEKKRPRLEAAMAMWNDEPDFEVARCAIDYVRCAVPVDASPSQIDLAIGQLPAVAELEVTRLGIKEKGTLTMDEVQEVIMRQSLELGA